MRLDISPSNAEVREALNSISAFDGKARLRIEDAVRVSVKEMAGRARSRVPRRTGKLKKSIFFSFRKTNCTGYFGAKAPHAHLIELGVKRSDEYPKHAKDKHGKPAALRIIDTAAVRFAARAVIPKRAKRPFIRPSYEEERPNLIKRLKEAVKSK